MDAILQQILHDLADEVHREQNEARETVQDSRVEDRDHTLEPSNEIVDQVQNLPTDLQDSEELKRQAEFWISLPPGRGAPSPPYSVNSPADGTAPELAIGLNPFGDHILRHPPILQFRHADSALTEIATPSHSLRPEMETKLHKSSHQVSHSEKLLPSS